MKNSNVLVCKNVFQVMLAAHIVDIYKEENFYVIILNENNTDKLVYYNNLLIAKVDRCLFFKPLKLSKIGSILDFFRFKLIVSRYLKKIEINKLFVAGIDNSLIHLLIDKLPYQNLCSFDDGLANLTESGHYYIKQKSLSIKLKDFLFQVESNPTNIRNKIDKHFTIFDNNPFVTPEKVIKFNFFNKEELTNGNKSEIRKIFVGQPVFEVKKDADYDFVEVVLRNLEVDEYYPHPREDVSLSSSIKIISSKLLFEDYILTCMKDSPNVNFIIYSFFSTVLINLQGCNVICIAVGDRDMIDNPKKGYKILKERGVKIVEL